MLDIRPDPRYSVEAKLLYNILEELKEMRAEFKMVGWQPTFGSCQEEPKEEPKADGITDDTEAVQHALEPKGYYCKICKVDHATAGERIKCGMKNKKG